MRERERKKKEKRKHTHKQKQKGGKKSITKETLTSNNTKFHESEKQIKEMKEKTKKYLPFFTVYSQGDKKNITCGFTSNTKNEPTTTTTTIITKDSRYITTTSSSLLPSLPPYLLSLLSPSLKTATQPKEHDGLKYLSHPCGLQRHPKTR